MPRPAPGGGKAWGESTFPSPGPLSLNEPRSINHPGDKLIQHLPVTRLEVNADSATSGKKHFTLPNFLFHRPCGAEHDVHDAQGCADTAEPGSSGFGARCAGLRGAVLGLLKNKFRF